MFLPKPEILAAFEKAKLKHFCHASSTDDAIKQIRGGFMTYINVILFGSLKSDMKLANINLKSSA